MTTPLMKSSFDNFFKYFGTPYFPYEWNSKSALLGIRNPKDCLPFYLSLTLNLINIIILIGHGVLSLTLRNKNESKSGTTMNLFLLGFMGLSITFCQTTLLYGQDFSDAAQRAVSIEKQLKKTWKLNPSSRRSESKKLQFDSCGVVLFAINLTSGIPIIFTVFGVYYGMDPISTALNQLDWQYKDSILTAALKYIMIGISVTEGWRIIAFYVGVATFWLQLILHSIQTIKMPPYRWRKHSGIFRKVLEMRDFRKALHIYNALRITVNSMKNAFGHFLPPLMFLGIVIMVVSNYAVVKLYGRIEPGLYLLFLTSLIAVCFIIMSLLPRAGNIYENSKEFKAHWKPFARTKFQRKSLVAMREIRIHIGNHFFCKRSTISTFVQVIFDCTVNALLSY